MIDRLIKRGLGQMIKGVQVVGSAHGGVERLYTSHWVCQVSFAEPILLASVSPRHDTYPLIEASGRFSVSVLAGDQVTEGQYFSYPGRRFGHVAREYVEEWEGLPVVTGAISWLACRWHDRLRVEDHELFIARVEAVHEGRLDEAPLVYSARHGWRVTGGPAREPGNSVRDGLLARIGEDPDAGHRAGPDDPTDA